MPCICFTKKNKKKQIRIRKTKLTDQVNNVSLSPPPPPNPPVGPSLTDAEIIKIKKNLDTINDFNTAIFNEQTSIINEVFTKLHGSQYPTPQDVKNNIWSTIFSTALEVIAILSGNPAVEIGITICLNISEYVFENTGNLSQYIGINLDNDASDLFARNLNSYNANQIYLSYIYEDPNTYRDSQYTYNNKTYTIRDLINIDVPGKDTTDFNYMVEINSRIFRNRITIPEMVKMQFWDIYFVQDNTYPEAYFGTVYRPPDITVTGGNQRSRAFDANNVGVNQRIFANDEIWHRHPDYQHAEAFGSDNNDLKSSYLNAIKSFIEQFPSSFVHPWTVTDSLVYSYRWYIMEGYGKIPDGSTNYGLANGDFLKWLFIDDGAGHVLNPNGVMYRYDILNSNIFSYQNAMPKENYMPTSSNILFKSTDSEYLYPGCDPNVTSIKICTN